MKELSSAITEKISAGVQASGVININFDLQITTGDASGNFTIPFAGDFSIDLANIDWNDSKNYFPETQDLKLFAIKYLTAIKVSKTIIDEITKVQQ